jgi:DNA-directed RNA polymerase subunit M/transcription elongation factor TFIIS
MAIEELPPFTIECPGCQRKLKVPDKMQGKRTTCPACKAPIDIPVKSGGASVPVASPQAKVASVTTNSLDQELDDFGFELAKIQEKPPRKEDEVLNAQLNLNLNLKTPREEEFRYPCKVCGTAMYAQKKDIGSMARCPDCYSEFSVPSPPKILKPKTPGPSLESYADMPLVPPEPAKEKSRAAGRSSASEYLANAEKELDNVEDQRRSVSYDFDASGWLKRTFAFLVYTTLILVPF